MQMEEDGDYAPTFVRTKPRQTFAYIDYPGYVSPAPASTRKALKQMGGLPLLERVLTGKPQANDFIELKLRPTNALGHPVPGTTVEQNQIVLKVVTRKRKVLPGVTPENSGVYTVEYAGVTQQATYFRGQFRAITTFARTHLDAVLQLWPIIRSSPLPTISQMSRMQYET